MSIKFLRVLTPANLFLCLLLVFAIACKKDPNTVGLDVQPENDKLNVLYNDTFSVVSYSVKEDSILPTRVDSVLIGAWSDATFGKSTASAYFQVRIANNQTNLVIGDSLAFDSLVLVLPYCYKYYYGDTNDVQTFEVYELDKDLKKDSAYYSNANIPYKAALLGSITAAPKPGKGIKTFMRIKLDKTSFGQDLMNQSGTTNFADNTNFLKYLKGLYVKPINNFSGTQGAALGINLINSAAGLELYCRKGVAGPKETPLKIPFQVGSSAVRVSRFENDYSMADMNIQKQINKTDTLSGQNQVFIKDAGGLSGKLQFPTIKNLITAGPVVINKAELIVTIDGSISTNYGVPARIVLGQKTTPGKYSMIIDQQKEGVTFVGGTLDNTKQQYKFVITHQLQAMLENRTKEKFLYLLPGNAEITANQLSFGGGNSMQYKMKLQLTYTKLY